MGCCTSSCEETDPPQRSYEEHTHVQRQLRVGVQFEKSPDGELHIGLKSGLESHRDKDVKVLSENTDTIDGDQEDVLSTIPRVLDLVEKTTSSSSLSRNYRKTL